MIMHRSKQPVLSIERKRFLLKETNRHDGVSKLTPDRPTAPAAFLKTQTYTCRKFQITSFTSTVTFTVV